MRGDGELKKEKKEEEVEMSVSRWGGSINIQTEARRRGLDEGL